MSTIKRHDPYYISDQGSRLSGDMREDEDGDWVSYEDYEALARRIQELEAKQSHEDEWRRRCTASDVCIEIYNLWREEQCDAACERLAKFAHASERYGNHDHALLMVELNNKELRDTQTALVEAARRVQALEGALKECIASAERISEQREEAAAVIQEADWIVFTANKALNPEKK